MNITPADKAEEILLKMCEHQEAGSIRDVLDRVAAARQCALLCVNYIIESHPHRLEPSGLIFKAGPGYTMELDRNYWIKVREELEKHTFDCTENEAKYHLDSELGIKLKQDNGNS